MEMSRLTIRAVSPADAQVQELVHKLDTFQIELYGRGNCHLDSIEVLLQSGAHMLGAYQEEVLVGIGAVKIMNGYAEIKRMYVEENQRGKGIAERILAQLEAYAQVQGITEVKLETGVYHQAAQALYRKMGYDRIEVFGDYRENGLSVFMGKDLP
jgi:putative acetyltransferase